MANQSGTILIIEDEMPQREALRSKMEAAGYDVMEAKNGEEGLRKALTVHPDIILLDLIMPKMDGFAVAKALREDAWGKDARVIVLTNSQDAQSAEVDSSIQNMAFLVKSDTTIEQVMRKVEEMLPAKQ
jgi:CheY-like chemotaxis protein